jgi:hypothetical protein
MPVIVAGRKLRRVADEVAVLSAGADLKIDLPADVRVLRLHIERLLSRAATAKHLLLMRADELLPYRDPTVYTQDLDYFCSRISEEIVFSLQSNTTFTLAGVRVSGAVKRIPELSSAAAMLSRSSDVTYAGPAGIVVLLAEAAEANPFIDRFLQRWSFAPVPAIETCAFTGSEDFADSAIDFIAQCTGGATGASLETAPVKARAAVNGGLASFADAKDEAMPHVMTAGHGGRGVG